MTVQQLIEALQALPDQSARVVVQGYEGGYSDPQPVEPIELALNQNEGWYYGPHDRWEPGFDSDSIPHEPAYLIPRS